MATINDYTSDKVVENVKLTIFFLKFVKLQIIGPFIGKKLLEKIKTFDPGIISIKQASDIILKSTNAP